MFHSLMKLRWTPSSRSWLLSLDKRIREQIIHPNNGKMVEVTYGKDVHTIWTVTVKGGQSDTIPLVIFHGMGGGCNMFLNNIDALAEKRDVILIDLPGFGLSSRPELRVKKEGYWRVDTTVDDIDEFYADVLNLWFEEMGLERVVLLGHSYGGYISSVYCLKYPKRVKHLILADPWGFPPEPTEAEKRPFMRRKSVVLLSKVLTKMNLFTPLRVLGPFGPFVLNYLRADLRRKFSSFFADNTFSDYFYALNTCDSPSGEVGFSRVSVRFGWAVKPIVERVHNWAEDLDVTFIYGARSWVDSSSGRVTQELRPGSYVDVQVIVDAGHHVYADRPKAFNDMVQKICEAIDDGRQPSITDEYKQRNKALSKLLRRPSCESYEETYNEDNGVRHRRSMSAHELSSHQEMDLEEELDEQGVVEKVQFSLQTVPGEVEECSPSVDHNVVPEPSVPVNAFI
uniref:AB hydrolase-1 domain-containing protein n=1 Tax=Arion vulgaris TaxID=1028688 RepID=A0A0B7B3J1_9EUPU